MAIYLNDQETTLSGDCLEAVIASASQQLAAGHTVVEVILDGQTLLGQQLKERYGDVVQDQELHLYTANVLDLSRSVLEALLGQLDDAIKMQNQAADLLSQDKQAQAMEPIGKAIDIWQQTMLATAQASQMIGAEISALEIAGKPAGQLIEQLAGQLRIVRDAIKQGDTVSLSDALAYEWPDMAAAWQQLLNQLLEKLDAVDDNPETSP